MTLRFLPRLADPSHAIGISHHPYQFHENSVEPFPFWRLKRTHPTFILFHPKRFQNGKRSTEVILSAIAGFGRHHPWLRPA
jgi:hypothetical protein